MKKFSKAFEEYITKRCEEVLESSDKTETVIECKLLKIEQQLKSTLSPDQVKLLEKYEDIMLDIQYKNYKLIYKQGFKDMIKIHTT